MWNGLRNSRQGCRVLGSSALSGLHDQGKRTATPIAASRCVSGFGVPPHGLGERIDQIGAWLDANCGANGWAMAPVGLHGVLNDAIAIYVNDATLAGAFVARCAGYKVESADGAFQIREDAPTPRLFPGLHKTP
jgi:hypothetical protein